VDAERAVAGVQTYVAAPVAVSVVALPLQIATGAPALTTGIGFTETVMVVLLVQPAAFVPVTVYIVVADGCAVTDAPVVAESPVDGAQL
jgi:hypothetical protein